MKNDNIAKEANSLKPGTADDKDILKQQDMIDEVETFRYDNRGRKVLETKEGKNNGALPAAFKNQRTNHP